MRRKAVLLRWHVCEVKPRDAERTAQIAWFHPQIGRTDNALIVIERRAQRHANSAKPVLHRQKSLNSSSPLNHRKPNVWTHRCDELGVFWREEGALE